MSSVYQTNIICLDTLTADPSPLADGQLWYRSDLDEVRARVNGATEVLNASFGVTETEITATAAASTTSATFVLMDSMTSTPASGKYVVTFSGSGTHTTMSSAAEYALFKDGTQVTGSLRSLGWGGGAHTNDLRMAMHTMAIIEVNGSQAIEVKWKKGASDTFWVYERNLILLKI